MATRRILAGDIGGTNSRLALCEVEDTRVRALTEATEPSRNHGSLRDVIAAFAAGNDLGVDAACFGIPGPVRGRRVVTTNLPWEVDADVLEQSLGAGKVFILNDLEAYAHGLSTLSPDAFVVLREGEPDTGGNLGLIAAGTGLGQAGLVRAGDRLVPFATEGGHTDFGPGSEIEIDLLRWLQARYGAHVSWERVVSGPGLVNIYTFLRDRDPGAEPRWLAQELQANDPAEVITRHALSGKDALCDRAVSLFLGLYGAEAGNLALKLLATGGMFLGGGIAPRLTDRLADSDFVERFDGKGRMGRITSRIPIRLVLDDKAGLWGAAHYAARAMTS